MIINEEDTRGTTMSVKLNLTGDLDTGLRTKRNSIEPERLKLLVSRNKILPELVEPINNIDIQPNNLINDNELDEIEQKILNDTITLEEFSDILIKDPSALFVIYFKNMDIIERDESEDHYKYIKNLFSAKIHLDIATDIKQYKNINGFNSIKNLPEKGLEMTDSNNSANIDGTQEQTNKLNKDSFFKEDLMKDTNNNTVEKGDYAVEVKKTNGKGEALIEAAIKNTLRGFNLSIVNIGTYGLHYFTGIDPFGPLSGRKFITENNKEVRDKLLTTDLDKNLIYNLAPDIILLVSKFFKDRKIRIGASTTPLLFQLIANMKERGNPLVFDKETGEIDIGQLLVLFIPIITEIASPLFKSVDADSFSSLTAIGKGLWGSTTQKAISPDDTYLLKERMYRSNVRPVKQPGNY